MPVYTNDCVAKTIISVARSTDLLVATDGCQKLHTFYILIFCSCIHLPLVKALILPPLGLQNTLYPYIHTCKVHKYMCCAHSCQQKLAFRQHLRTSEMYTSWIFIGLSLVTLNNVCMKNNDYYIGAQKGAVRTNLPIMSCTLTLRDLHVLCVLSLGDWWEGLGVRTTGSGRLL